MASTTRCCAKLPDALCPALACLLALLAGCSPAESNFGFSVTRVECRFSGESLHVAVQQQLILSNEAKEALIHGVPLVFQTRVMVRARRSHEELQQDNRVFEIRYLPLSERYQLSASPPLEVHTFPRLRHALGELTTVEFTFANLQMPPADMELRVRSQLDKRQTPPPMRLPVWFSAQWNHDSGWTSWPLGTGSGP